MLSACLGITATPSFVLPGHGRFHLRSRLYTLPDKSRWNPQAHWLLVSFIVRRGTQFQCTRTVMSWNLLGPPDPSSLLCLWELHSPYWSSRTTMDVEQFRTICTLTSLETHPRQFSLRSSVLEVLWKHASRRVIAIFGHACDHQDFIEVEYDPVDHLLATQQETFCHNHFNQITFDELSLHNVVISSAPKFNFVWMGGDTRLSRRQYRDPPLNCALWTSDLQPTFTQAACSHT